VKPPKPEVAEDIDSGPPTEQLDMGALLAEPPTEIVPEMAASATAELNGGATDLLEQGSDDAGAVEGWVTRAEPESVTEDAVEPLPAPPPAYSRGEDSPPPPPPPPAGGERIASEAPGSPPTPPPPPRSSFVPRSVTQAAVAAAHAAEAGGAESAEAVPGLAARVRSVAPTPPPPARESFVDELRKAIGDDDEIGDVPVDDADDRSWFGRRG
jgi:hypothetical protein